MTDFASIIPDVQKHAAEVAPKECCGVAVVTKGKLRYWRCRNLLKNSNDNFCIDPEDWAEAEESGSIIAIVHSHVGVPAVPSMADLVGIEINGLPWVIVNHPTGDWGVFEPRRYKAPLLGRPFVHGVLDCYSLAKDWYMERGIDLPEFQRDELWWEKGQNILIDNFERFGFTRIDESELKPGDAILMQSGSDVPNHCAVYLGDNIIMHHWINRLSSRDVYGGYFRKCATHFLRYVGVRK